MASIILKNWPLKVLALLTAIFLWSYVVNEGYRVNYVDTQVKVEAYNLSDDLATSHDLGVVNLNIRIPNSLTNFSSDDVLAFVDLKNLHAGTYTKDIGVSFNNPDIKLINIEPKQLNITLEPLETIKKTIEPDISGAINDNYELLDPKLSLQEAEIKGSQTALEKVSRIVAPLTLSGEQTEIKSLVELEARDIDNNKITNLVIIPKTAEITIPIRKKEEIKTVGIKAILTGNPAPGYWVKQITFNPSTIAISGEFEKVNALEYLNTKPIDINNIASDRQQAVSLELPEGVQATGDDNIQVNISVDSQTTTKNVSASISFINILNSLEVSQKEPENIILTIEGPAPTLNTLDSLNAQINLSGKNAGGFTITIDPTMFTLPAGVTIKSFDPKTVNITIKKK